jgi:cation transport regulator
MPYETVQALPERLRQFLPLRAQEIYWEAFNTAWGQYADTHHHPAALEEAVSRSAWAAVKRHYRQDTTTGRWRLLTAPAMSG